MNRRFPRPPVPTGPKTHARGDEPALIDRGLLATASRVGRNGVRKTNITRVNLSSLEALRRAEKSYSDDVIAELDFKTDPPETRSDKPKCTTCTRGDQPRCTTCTYQVNQVPPIH